MCYTLKRKEANNNYKSKKKERGNCKSQRPIKQMLFSMHSTRGWLSVAPRGKWRANGRSSFYSVLPPRAHGSPSLSLVEESSSVGWLKMQTRSPPPPPPAQLADFHFTRNKLWREERKNGATGIASHLFARWEKGGNGVISRWSEENTIKTSAKFVFLCGFLIHKPLRPRFQAGVVQLITAVGRPSKLGVELMCRLISVQIGSFESKPCW